MSTTDQSIQMKQQAKAKKAVASNDDVAVRIRITPPVKPPINLVPYLAALGTGILFSIGVKKRRR